MQQNQMMQAQMMNQNNFNIQNNNEPEKMNLLFELKPHRVINIQCVYGTKIKDALEMFAHRIGKNKNQFRFIFNVKLLDYNDDRKIEQVFICSRTIMVQDK